MLRFVVWRLIHVVPVLLGVSFVVFSVLYLIPGDIAHTLLSMFYTEERAAMLREELGLDRPMFVPIRPLALGRVARRSRPSR